MSDISELSMSLRTKVDGLLESRSGEQAGGVSGATHGGDKLSSSTMDGISVKLKKKTVNFQRQISEKKLSSYIQLHRGC